MSLIVMLNEVKHLVVDTARMLIALRVNFFPCGQNDMQLSGR